MNNKGFTLIEVISVVVIISCIGIIITFCVKNTFSMTTNEAYNIMKSNIVSAASNYVQECNSGIMKCNLSENTSISVDLLVENGYLRDLKSPKDGKNLNLCLFFKFRMQDGSVIVDLIDSCY